MAVSYECIRLFTAILDKPHRTPCRIITIGRQGLSDKNKTISFLIREGLIPQDRAEEAERVTYFDEICDLMGLRVESLDFSDYEKASIVHDMNRPIPAKYKKKFNIVIDGGSLEHVFNFSTAIKNCMEMTAQDGYFISVSNANNYMGSGLYQFSPDLFYRALDRENGFRMERCMLLEHRLFRKRRRYVKDPALVSRRVELINRFQTSLYVVARRFDARSSIFSIFPAQSDYKAKWSGKGGGSFLSRMYARVSRLSTRLVFILSSLYMRFYLHTLSNRSCYSKKPPKDE